MKKIVLFENGVTESFFALPLSREGFYSIDFRTRADVVALAESMLESDDVRIEEYDESRYDATIQSEDWCGEYLKLIPVLRLSEVSEMTKDELIEYLKGYDDKFLVAE